MPLNRLLLVDAKREWHRDTLSFKCYFVWLLFSVYAFLSTSFLRSAHCMRNDFGSARESIFFSNNLRIRNIIYNNNFIIRILKYGKNRFVCVSPKFSSLLMHVWRRYIDDTDENVNKSHKCRNFVNILFFFFVFSLIFFRPFLSVLLWTIQLGNVGNIKMMQVNITNCNTPRSSVDS